jgi:1-acyl-sn-glycerol-3-phosphate acyltransferase
MISRTYRIWRFFCAWLVHIIFFVIPHGRENEPDIGSGPYLLCSNHISAVDPVIICDSVKKQQPRYMAKKEIFSWPVIGKIVGWLGAYPVDRAGRDAGVILKTVKMIEDGMSVGLFPQGTRRPGVDPAGTPLRNGTGLICSKTRARVLPVYIRTRGNRRRFLRPVHVYIGKPIPYEEYTSDGEFAGDYRHITEYVFGRICELGREAEKGKKKRKDA